MQLPCSHYGEWLKSEYKIICVKYINSESYLSYVNEIF